MRRPVGLAALALLAASCGGTTSQSAVDPIDVEAGAQQQTTQPDRSPDDDPIDVEAGDQQRTTQRERLPDVEVTDLVSGEVLQLSGIGGPAVINLWATWCAPCRAEIPDFEEVHRARADEVRFVGINIGEDADRAIEFIDEVGATYDQFLDLDGAVASALRATSMPVTLVIDADGHIDLRHLGPLDQDDLNDAIDDAIAANAAQG